MPSCYYWEEGRGCRHVIVEEGMGCRHVITGRKEGVAVMLLQGGIIGLPSCYYREEGRGCRHVITGWTEEVTVMLLERGRTGLPSEKKKKSLFKRSTFGFTMCTYF